MILNMNQTTTNLQYNSRNNNLNLIKTAGPLNIKGGAGAGN
jgi:hypothetical protein